MDIYTPTLKQAGTTLGYVVLSVVATAAIALAVLYVAQPVQKLVYDLFYLQVGPSEATETAILTHFLLAGVSALSVVVVACDYLSDRGANLPTLAWVVAALVGLVVLFLMVALAGLAAFLSAFLVLAIGFIGIPLVLRYRARVRSGAVPAFVGGIPVIVLLLFLAGVGLGWGWGYIMTAEEVPASAVNVSEAANFDDFPAVRDELFVGECETTTEDRQICRMYLRGSEHEAAAARFMAQNGVNCPYQNTGVGRSEAFIAERDGTYYRVTCSPHGD